MKKYKRIESVYIHFALQKHFLEKVNLTQIHSHLGTAKDSLIKNINPKYRKFDKILEYLEYFKIIKKKTVMLYSSGNFYSCVSRRKNSQTYVYRDSSYLFFQPHPTGRGGLPFSLHARSTTPDFSISPRVIAALP